MKHVIYIYFLFAFFFLTSTNIFSQNTTKINQEIIDLLEKKKQYNKLVGSGYTIQLYNGNELEAKKLLARFKIEFPETDAKLLYETPDWKVQVGEYKVKLDADRASLLFKEEFNNIIVVPLGK